MANTRDLPEARQMGRMAPFAPMHNIGGNDMRYLPYFRRPFIPAYDMYDNLQQYSNPGAGKPHGIQHNNRDKWQDHGVVTAASPPQQIRDVIFTHQYADGRFNSSRWDMQKGSTILHTLTNPMTGQKTFSFQSAKGGQLEGY